MKMKKIISISLIAALALTACGNNNKAQDKTIKKAIEDYHAAHPLCMALPPAIDNGLTNVLGNDSVRFLKTDANGKRINTTAVKQMSILTSAGIYKKGKDIKQPEIGKKAWLAVYDLTEKGKQYTRNEQGNHALCIGTLSVKEIKWYSDPTADNGVTVTRVAYQGKYRLHKWAEKILQLGNAKLHSDLGKITEAQAVLVKTNKGWIDKRELKNNE